MTCTHNCTHQICPSPMACRAPLPTISVYPKDETMPANLLNHFTASLMHHAAVDASSPDDMTYSGPFHGHGILPYVDQANSDGSDPHGFDWIDSIVGKLIDSPMARLFLILGGWAVLSIVAMLAGYFWHRAGL